MAVRTPQLAASKRRNAGTGLPLLKHNHADMLTNMQLNVDVFADELFHYDLFHDLEVDI